MSANKRNALGKGLSALLKNADGDNNGPVVNNSRPAGSISQIPISQIEANPFQPRTEFEQGALEELSESIKIHGVIQPITVRKIGVDQYQIISGERRTKASILAGLTTIPAYIRLANDQEMLEMALIENIQRENLNPIEIALSYQRLQSECNLKLEELADRVGKKRSTVNNYLRLLKLPVEIQAGLRDGRVSMGHARAIINIDDPDLQMSIYLKVIEQGLSVRDIESLARASKENKGSTPTKNKESEENIWAGYQNQTETLADKLQVKVKLKAKGNGKGELVIPFESEADLLRIFESL